MVLVGVAMVVVAVVAHSKQICVNQHARQVTAAYLTQYDRASELDRKMVFSSC